MVAQVDVSLYGVQTAGFGVGVGVQSSSRDTAFAVQVALGGQVELASCVCTGIDTASRNVNAIRKDCREWMGRDVHNSGDKNEEPSIDKHWMVGSPKRVSVVSGRGRVGLRGKKSDFVEAGFPFLYVVVPAVRCTDGQTLKTVQRL